MPYMGRTIGRGNTFQRCMAIIPCGVRIQSQKCCKSSWMFLGTSAFPDLAEYDWKLNKVMICSLKHQKQSLPACHVTNTEYSHECWQTLLLSLLCTVFRAHKMYGSMMLQGFLQSVLAYLLVSSIVSLWYHRSGQPRSCHYYQFCVSDE